MSRQDRDGRPRRLVPAQGVKGPQRPQRPQHGGRGRPHGGRPPRRDYDPVVETLAPQPLPVLDRRERRMHIVSDAPSDGPYGKAPRDRSIDELISLGLIILDKPRGPTSHQVVAWLRDMLGVERVGHGGTLDPKVSGVLPTTTGDATKAVPALQGDGKEYITVMRLHGDAPEDAIRAQARRFIGRIRQVPPVRSAVARRARERRIYDIEVLEIDDRDVLMRVQCEAGTYIRNLCVDLGKALGPRGHMAELRRTRSGLFGEDAAVSLYDVKDALHEWKEQGDEKPLRNLLHPIEHVLDHLPQLRIRDSAVDAVCHGADLAAPGLAAVEEGITPGTRVAVVSAKGEGVALATAILGTEAMVEADSGAVAKLERVVMRPGTYPAMWKKRKTETRRVG